MFSVLLFAGQARWGVTAYDTNFNQRAGRDVVFNYSGQAITIAGIKTITADQHDFIYTGVDSVVNGVIYYQIEPIPFWPDPLVWVRIDETIHVHVTE